MYHYQKIGTVRDESRQPYIVTDIFQVIDDPMFFGQRSLADKTAWYEDDDGTWFLGGNTGTLDQDSNVFRAVGTISQNNFNVPYLGQWSPHSECGLSDHYASFRLLSGGSLVTSFAMEASVRNAARLAEGCDSERLIAGRSLIFRHKLFKVC